MSASEHADRSGFSQKEMLVRVLDTVDRIEQSLNAKADRRDIEAVEVRIVAVEAAANLRLLALERSQSDVAAVGQYRKWLIATALALLVAVIGILALVVSLHR